MYSFPGYHFKDQHDGERIIQIIHRHWFNLLIQFFVVIVAALGVFGSWIFILFMYPALLQQVGVQTISFIETTALLFVWFYGFLIWIDYYFDVWIITNERIVNIEQKGLFLRQASDLQFSKIQDVTTDVVGLIPTILNYGDVYIQTAGETERFKFRQVPDPYAIKSLIMQMYGGAEKVQP
ncbi:MAG: PH domain-containing protein [Candidatus Moranbacteria bacterium]|nr:PH domain-containing protein [Candidatus Moranbacteria bacterium]